MLAASPTATGTVAGSAIAGAFQRRNRRLLLRCSRRPIEAIANILYVIFPLPVKTKVSCCLFVANVNGSVDNVNNRAGGSTCIGGPQLARTRHAQSMSLSD